MPNPQHPEREIEREPGPFDKGGVLDRFTQAAKGIHEVAEKLRAMRRYCPTCGKPDFDPATTSHKGASE